MDTVVTALREVTVAELRLAATLHGTGCVRLLRGRGRYDAAVMAHAGELSRRMPDLWEVAEDDGRLSVVHLHVIWTAVRRRTVRCPEATAELDLTCEVAVIELLDATEGPLSVEDLRDVLERVLTTAAPFLSAEAERRTPGVRRRGSRIVVECGDDVTAGLCMAAVRTAARRRGGSPVEAAVDLLRGSPERVTVHLHLFRAPGGPGYVPGTGWVSPCTADLWAEVATRVHRHTEVPPGGGPLPAVGGGPAAPHRTGRALPVPRVPGAGGPVPGRPHRRVRRGRADGPGQPALRVPASPQPQDVVRVADADAGRGSDGRLDGAGRPGVHDARAGAARVSARVTVT